MDLEDLIHHTVRAFEVEAEPYMLVGSVATILYGEPRLTLDIDIIADLSMDGPVRLESHFPQPNFRIARSSGRLAIDDVTSGLKVDVILANADQQSLAMLARRQAVRLSPDCAAAVASVEDVLLMRLLDYRAGHSDQHFRDLKALLRISGDALDLPYLAQATHALGVCPEWQAAQTAAICQHG